MSVTCPSTCLTGNRCRRGRGGGPACCIRPKRRLVIVALGDGEVDPMGNEPILSGGAVIGRLTSGGYMFHVKQSVGLGYIRGEFANDLSVLEVEILGDRRPARVLMKPPYDPDGKRLRM